MGKKDPSPCVKGNEKDVKLKYIDSSNTGLQLATCFLPASFLPDTNTVRSSTRNIYRMVHTNFAIPKIKQTFLDKHY